MKNRLSKLAVTAVAALTVGFAFAIPTSADAGGGYQYSHRCGSCGSPVYRRLVLSGYDHCRRPVHRWVTVGHTCRSRSRQSGHSGHHSGSNITGHLVNGAFRYLINRGSSHRGHSYRGRGGSCR